MLSVSKGEGGAQSVANARKQRWSAFKFEWEYNDKNIMTRVCTENVWEISICNRMKHRHRSLFWFSDTYKPLLQTQSICFKWVFTGRMCIRWSDIRWRKGKKKDWRKTEILKCPPPPPPPTPTPHPPPILVRVSVAWGRAMVFSWGEKWKSMTGKQKHKKKKRKTEWAANEQG